MAADATGRIADSGGGGVRVASLTGGGGMATRQGDRMLEVALPILQAVAVFTRSAINMGGFMAIGAVVRLRYAVVALETGVHRACGDVRDTRHVIVYDS